MNNINKSRSFKFLLSMLLVVLLNIPVLNQIGFKLNNLLVLPGSSKSANAQTTYGLTCINGMAACTSGLSVTCVDSNYTPTCFGDPNFNPIECCRNNGISLQCRPDLTFICGAPLSSTSTSTTSTSTTSSSTTSSGALCSTGTYCSNGFVPDCTSTESFMCIGDTMNIPVCINNITFDKRTPNCILPACTSSGSSFCMPGLVPDCNSQEMFKCIGGVGNIPCCFEDATDICRVPNCIDPLCMVDGMFCVGGLIPDCNAGEVFQCVDSMPYCVMSSSPTGQARIPNCIVPSCTSGSYCSSGLIPDCNVSETFMCVNGAPCCLNNTTFQCRIPLCITTSSSSSSGGSSSSSSSGASSSSSSSGASSSSSSSGGSSSSSSSGGSSSSSSSGGSSSSSSSGGSSSSSSSGGSSSSSSSGGSSSSSSGAPPRINGSKNQDISTEVLNAPRIFNQAKLSESLNVDSMSAICYSDSQPSFEIQVDGVLSGIISAELRDSEGKLYKNLFAKVSSTDREKVYVLTISIPANVSEGRAVFSLKTSDYQVFNGVVYITSPLKAKAMNKNGKVSNQIILKPVINRVSISRDGDDVLLLVKGNNFVGQSFLFKENNSTKFVVSEPKASNSLVTIFPSSLGLVASETYVSAGGTLLKVKLTGGADVNAANAVLIISTPAGSASKSIHIE